MRTTAGWLAGRLLLLLLILAALVVWDTYRDESMLLTAQLKALVPDEELVVRLESGRAELERFAADGATQINARLRTAPQSTAAAIERRLIELQAEITAKEAARPAPIRRTIALMTGEGIADELENEIELALLIAERDALRSIQNEVEARRARLREGASDFEQKRLRTLQTWDSYLRRREELRRYLDEHWFLANIPGTRMWVRASQLRRQLIESAREYEVAGDEFLRAREQRRRESELRPADFAQVRSPSAAILEPLDRLIAAKRASLASAERQAEKLRQSVRRVFIQALVILLVITTTPIGIKAFWYGIVAPLIEKRPPIRLQPSATASPARDVAATVPPLGREKISAVSQEIRLDEGEELLVHPDYLQSTAHRGRKTTKWLLDRRYPLTSIAAGMVGLTRIRAGAAETYVVSSRNDALAEVGVIRLAEGQALVLQPRNLIGLVQSVERPIHIRRRWIFGLSAWITLQFRYLVFEGPGVLLVQGCRGVRVEPAGTGRAIDQNATMGFSANLDYAPRRSETFGAYLMGASGLFNDSFAGGPGFFVYEEMPYAGRRAGLTGRGFGGFTDALLKIVGI